ncbi:Gldg family protein [Kordiimonas sp. SCSIO 12610]|uniref:GldG family protein n=1 Tax=Kordiimonas sp. SCSIO 12610 TaxID=2829597 RepID=UPI00210A5604|nr:Gldg family protein [Kordiimonas sp. SCSIO 12610]UTW55722.1 Gldg family protein [Kordiimonas sp. SCSIO 12610]
MLKRLAPLHPLKPIYLMVLACLLFLSLSVLSDRFLRGISFDLTEDNLYTLSSGTKETLKAIEEPVQVTFYFSRSLAAPYPSLLSYGKRIEDTLKAFQAVAPGVIELSFVDPEPFSEAEDEAVEAGLTGAPLGDGSVLYFGVSATNSTNGAGNIPFISEERETFLEYDLIKMIIDLDALDKPKLALLSQLPLQFGPGGPQAALQGQSQPYVIYEQLQERFDITDLDQDFTDIPVETDILMLVHPPQLNDDQLYKLDQFVLKGGRALIFLDPHSESLDPGAFAPNGSNLAPLLRNWGVEIPSDKVVGDASLAQRVQVGGFGADSIQDFVFWLGMRDGFLSKEDIVAGSVDTLNIASAGAILPLEGHTTEITPLVQSSTVSMLFDASRAVGTPDTDSLLRDLEPTSEAYTLVARIHGTAASAFPAKSGSDHVAEGSINLVLASDSDLFDNRFWVQLQDLLGQRIVVPIAGNGSFILNLADHLTGSEALLELRGRGISRRPFNVVDRLRREAEAKFLNEEQRLQNRMATVEARLAELESQKPEGATVISNEQEQEISVFRNELLETRKALRAVKRNLQGDIEQLGSILAFLNIAGVPIALIILIGLRTYLRRKQSVE